jgi:hypothetical protein
MSLIRFSTSLARVGLAALLFAMSAVAAASAEGESMTLAVNYLLGSQLPSGFLRYGFDFLEDASAEPGAMSAVQLTRQAGAAAMLADYYALTRDPRAAAASRQLLAAFGKHTLPIGQSRLQEFVAWTRLLSMPVGRYRIESALKRWGLLYETEGSGKLLSPDSNYGNAYAGAVALALLSEVRYAQATGDNRYAALRRAWLEGLMALRIPGDGFRQIPTSIDTHPYYDAEPWTALAEYHHAFPQDPRANDFLADVDAALMGKYGGKFSMDFVHWGVMAAAMRYADTRDRRFLEFIKAQTTEFLKRMEHQPNNDNNCADVEGVVDAMGALRVGGEEGSALYRQALRWTQAEMLKAQRMQIQPGQTELVFSNARIVAPRLQEFAGSFRSGLYKADTLVDLTGHCLSAMVKMKRQHIEIGESGH